MNRTPARPRPSTNVLRWSLLGLAAFLALEALLLGRFIRVDTRPPSWDQSTHLEIALDYRELLAAGRYADAWSLPPKAGMPPFPPLYHLLLRGAYGSPDPAHAALWLNWWYMVLLAASLFGIARRFFPDSRALAATLVFCAAPGLQDLMTTQLVDLAVVAWASAAYWALLESEGFREWGPSLAFGALAAAGMLHKWTFFSYLAPAYLAAGRALADRRTRPQALAATALSLALFAPWYGSHLALLPSRLVQASADFAVPFWKPRAWLDYLTQACTSLGPPLWALSLAGLFALRGRKRPKDAWIVAAWLGGSYLFWMIVPNRQIRFLMPGLVPLALVAAEAWPARWTWALAAFQLLTLANYHAGAAGPFRLKTPLMPVTFLANRPPRAEDWRTAEILSRVEADRDPSRALANVTMVANDVSFNGPTFHWMERALGLPHARLRGVNRRLCELSEFVLLKKGRLGPPDVIGGLEEAARTITAPGGWFAKAYDEDASWPLPDGSVAVLYRQKRGRPRPVESRAVAYPSFEAGFVSGLGLTVNLGAWDPKRSAWAKVSVGARRLEIRGLAIRDAAAELEGFSFVGTTAGTPRLYDWNELRLMRLDRVRVRGLRVDAEDLRAFLEKRVRGLAVDALTLDGTVKASGRWNGRPVAVEAALELDRAARLLRVRIVSASLYGFSVPPALFRPIKELNVSLEPNPETPFAVDLEGLTIKGGRLTVP